MTIEFSENAARRVLKMAELANKEKAFLRVRVDGGGCSGFQYVMELSDQQSDDDIVISNGNAGLLIDSISLPFLEGAKVDYVEELIGSYFKIINPNATASCGCGTSFSI